MGDIDLEVGRGGGGDEGGRSQGKEGGETHFWSGK
jgi:hypothetical protein